MRRFPQAAIKRTVIYYSDLSTGKEPAREWLHQLKDQKGRRRIYARIERIKNGNFGDHHSVGEGLMELRINSGPGYRLYYTLENNEIVLLLLGGDKSTQWKDIEIAKNYLDIRKRELRED